MRTFNFFSAALLMTSFSLIAGQSCVYDFLKPAENAPLLVRISNNNWGDIVSANKQGKIVIDNGKEVFMACANDNASERGELLLESPFVIVQTFLSSFQKTSCACWSAAEGSLRERSISRKLTSTCKLSNATKLTAWSPENTQTIGSAVT
jgi:hypothetical protein